MNSFQGRFLVAAPHQLDPNFVRSVILVVEHPGAGAFGLIVNGPSEECRRRHRNSRRLSPEKVEVFFGGPRAGPLMALHAKASLGEWQFLPGLFFSEKEKDVLALMRRAVQPCKIFFGYAAWEPGQLDHEVEQGLWQVVPAKPKQVFSKNIDLWEQLARQASRKQLQIMFKIKHIPADPLLD